MNLTKEFYFPFPRYKTKRAQHERGGGGPLPHHLDAHHMLMGGPANSGGHSPRRVAVPVLVRDGKPCGGSDATNTTIAGVANSVINGVGGVNGGYVAYPPSMLHHHQRWWYKH